jgi:mitochondrial fission protein ELM1
MEVRSERPGTGATERVWVLDDPQGSSQALGIAERLGVPFRRLPLAWNWLSRLAVLSPRGSLVGLAMPARLDQGGSLPARRGLELDLAADPGPALTLSSGGRSATVALWLKQRFGCRSIHCARPAFRGAAFDLLVIGQHETPPSRARALQVLGIPHRISPFTLRQARAFWHDRLDHMPRPRVALLVGGPEPEMSPALAHRLARRVAALAAVRGGSVLALTTRTTGAEATEAMAAGLSSTFNLVFRHGEPGENPYVGFLALADAIVVTADTVAMVSEACAAGAPVFLALPELAGMRERRLLAALFEAGQVRPLGEDLSPWPRVPLDEAGRVALTIRDLFPLD